MQFGLKTQTRIFDFSSLKEPKLHFKYFSNFDAIDHNGYIVGEHFFLANYSAGLRVIDISEVQNKTIILEDNIVEFVEKKGQSKRLILYACTSGYPVPFEDVCMLEINRLKENISAKYEF